MPELDYSQRQRIWRWLERLGFTEDPFAVYEADQERAALPYVFIDRPYVASIIGDPARPRSAFLLANRGAGKTATREMVAFECAHGRLRRRALPVRYCEFGPLMEQVEYDPQRITARHLIAGIVRATLQVLADDVPATFYDLLDPTEKSLLLGYAAQFGSPVAQFKLQQVVQSAPVQLAWDALSPAETLEALVKLVMRLGQSGGQRYEAIYVLVDRVDETPAGPGATVPILKPLVAESGLLGMLNVAFKFFLSVEAGEQLQAAVTLRRDRLSVETVSWDHQSLQDMLERRLAHYSNRRIEHFGQLCNTGARSSALSRLLAKSQESPRTLLRLCETLTRCHVQRTAETLIDLKDITDTLAEFDQKLKVEQLQATRPAMSAELATIPAGPPPQGLYLDDGGHVWVDGQSLTPPLTHLEFQLLCTLYRVSPEIVSREDLISAVWSGAGETVDEKLGVADEQNLRKLIARLRARLEPETREGAWRFLRNARGRGYWLNKV